MTHLTPDEIKQLLREIPSERQRLMIRVGFLHGLRVSELINLDRDSIRDGYVKVQRLKGSNKTVQPYVQHADPELDESKGLRELFRSVKPGEKLFPMTRNGVYKLMQRAGARAGIPAHKLHPHALKHACAKVSIDKIGIQRVRQYLGHKSISSTGEYLKESDESASQAFAGVMS
jgi:integrase